MGPNKITDMAKDELIEYYDNQFDRLLKLYKKIDNPKTSDKVKYNLGCEAKVIAEQTKWLEHLISLKK